MRVDLHQHLWTEPLIDRLAARTALPFVRRDGRRHVLHSVGEVPYLIDPAAEAPEHRAAGVRADGLDRAVVALSSPVGIEALPRDEALDLIAAHLAGVAQLPAEFAHWGPLALDQTGRRRRRQPA